MIGEIGGSAEEEAALFIKSQVTKPVVAYRWCNGAKRQAYGTCRSDYQRWKRNMADKIAARRAGVKTVRSLAEIGFTLRELFEIKT